jgi:hypothetical protein
MLSLAVQPSPVKRLSASLLGYVWPGRFEDSDRMQAVVLHPARTATAKAYGAFEVCRAAAYIGPG